MTLPRVIPIVDAAAAPPTLADDDVSHGNVQPILHEIRHALARLLDAGVATRIDLRAMPMGPRDEAALEEALGRGEVSGELRALGTSTVEETATPGVWLVTHRDESNQIVARFIDITFIPDLLTSPREDVAAGLQALAARIGPDTPSTKGTQ